MIKPLALAVILLAIPSPAAARAPSMPGPQDAIVASITDRVAHAPDGVAEATPAPRGGATYQERLVAAMLDRGGPDRAVFGRPITGDLAIQTAIVETITNTR